MTDIEREIKPSRELAGARPSSDRRANIGEYLLAMSHEIRAPLNAVIGMSGMLLDSELSENGRQSAKAVHAAGESLATILNDLLDLSRVAAGRLVIEPIPFDLKSTIEETASVLSPRANDRGLALRVDWRPELPRQVIGDPGRTRQVLGNLIGHAVNATSQGEVVIRVMPTANHHGTPSVRFVVEDTGIGIMPERLATIFEDYIPVDASPYRSFGVTGLGLRLSAELVRRMGGEIGAESEPGKGSRFWFVLPMPSAEPNDTVAVDSPIRTGRALVVEADSAARSRYVDQIEDAGWEVEVIDNQGLAIDTLREASAVGSPFEACFISDYAVRPLHFELAGKVKAEIALARTALVMVTAVGSPGDGKKLWHAGFAAYLRKPVPNEEMRDTLTALSAVGGDGRGSSLITRHSLAEARNAQAFAPDGIDEMLASLTPAVDDPSPIEDIAPPVQEPSGMMAIPTTDLAADLPAIESEATVAASPALPEPIAAALLAMDPVGDQAGVPVPEALLIVSYVPLFAARVLPVESGAAAPDPAPVDVVVDRPIVAPESEWERPEEFDPAAIPTAPADGLEAPEELVAHEAAELEGLLGHGLASGLVEAVVEKVELLPPGADIGTPDTALGRESPATIDLPQPIMPGSPEPEPVTIESVTLDAIPADAIHSGQLPVVADELPDHPELVAQDNPVVPVVEEPGASAPTLSLGIDLSAMTEPEDQVEAPPTTALAGSAAALAAPTAKAAPVGPAPEANPIDDGALPAVGMLVVDQLSHGGGFFTQYIVSSFVREVPPAIAELATAANRGDAIRMKQAGAILRFAANSVGAERLLAVTNRLEQAIDGNQLDQATRLIGPIEQAFVGARDELDRASPSGLPAELTAVSGQFLEQVGSDKEGPAKALAVRLIDSFSNDASAKILELREAVARGDAEQSQRVAQTIKGMCGLISAEPLAKLCALVEADARLRRIGQADRYLAHIDREFERVRLMLEAARR